jgi:hypothetical protein
MPAYQVRIETDVVLDQASLDRIEDVVYDVLTLEKGASTAVDTDGVGITDVQTVYN